MKKISSILLLLILATATTAGIYLKKDINSSFTELEKEKNIALVTYDKLINYSLKNNKIEKQVETSIKIPDEQNFDFAEFDNQLIFSLGHVTSSKNQFKIGRINMLNADFTTVKREVMPTTGMGYDTDYFYTMTSKNGFGTQIQQFNTQGIQTGSATLDKASIGVKILGSDNQVFMLAGVEDKEQSELIYTSKISVFEQEGLDYIKSYQFDDSQDDFLLGLTDMEIINQQLYLPISAKKHKTSAEWQTSKDILVFDLENEEKSFIQLDEYYPTSIVKDKSEENLIIFHEPYMLGKYILSIYNLKEQKTTTLDINELQGTTQAEVTGFNLTTTDDGKLVINTGNFLILYDIQENKVLDKIELAEDEKGKGLYLYSYNG